MKNRAIHTTLPTGESSASNASAAGMAGDSRASSGPSLANIRVASELSSARTPNHQGGRPETAAGTNPSSIKTKEISLSPAANSKRWEPWPCLNSVFAQISHEVLLRYNGMQVGPGDLLADSRDQANAVSGYIDALKEFWTAHAVLEGALGMRVAQASASAQAAPHGEHAE